MVEIVLGAVSLASAVFGFYVLVPRLEISFPSKLDPMRPLAANFTVTNVGTFPVYNVVCVYLARDLPNTMGVTFKDGGFSSPEMCAKQLGPGDRYTFSVERGIVFPPGAITAAEIEIVAAANPALWPFAKKYFRAAYRTHRSDSGELEWFAKPPSAPLPNGIHRVLE